MAAFLPLHLLSLLLFFSLSAAATNQKTPSPAANLPPPTKKSSNIIQEACKASRDSAQCQTWLSQSGHVPPNATVLQVIQSALALTSQNLDKGRAVVQDILKSSAGNVNRSTAASTCLDLVRFSAYRIKMVNGAAALTREGIKDARAWTTAALVYQYDCWSALKYVNDTAQVVQTMTFFNNSLIAGTSSALGMMVNYDVYSDKTGSWGPVRTERDGFWEPFSDQSGSVGAVPPLRVDVTVCKGGGACKFKTVQEAVNAAPDNLGPGKWFVIRIKAGVYEETVRVPLEKKNVVFLGDGMGKTVITGSKNAGQPGMSTYNSATVGVLGDGFMATGLTFQNTAGPETHQAVAFRSDSDRSIIEKCEFLGNQDTLYAHSLRQYYKSCLIQGNVDFIFGNSAAYFDDCKILIAPRQQNPEKGEKNAVTAHGRVDPAQSTGFVFQNCVINGTDAYLRMYRSNPKVHSNFLGRPWKTYARTVFVRCTLDGIISPGGWMPWDGDLYLNTCYYGEFKNVGSGSGTMGRVKWSSQIPEGRVGAYSVENFMQGDKWINPSAGADN